MTRQSDDEIDFKLALKGVRPLKQDKVDLYAQKPRNRAISRHQPMTPAPLHQVHAADYSLPESTADSWFHHGLQKKLQKKIRMGLFNIDDILDLHGYRQQRALHELERFLQHALQQRAKLVLIIHGQGFRSHSASVLRPLVQHWLSQQPLVLAYCPAQSKDGGIGASYVYLKNSAPG